MRPFVRCVRNRYCAHAQYQKGHAYPPPHMTHMYPPPHMTHMYPPPHMCACTIPEGSCAQYQKCHQITNLNTERERERERRGRDTHSLTQANTGLSCEQDLPQMFQGFSASSPNKSSHAAVEGGAGRGAEGGAGRGADGAPLSQLNPKPLSKL